MIRILRKCYWEIWVLKVFENILVYYVEKENFFFVVEFGFFLKDKIDVRILRLLSDEGKKS